MSVKPTTIKEIAKLLDISVSTVSRALNDHPSIGLTTKMRVRKIAKELNYEPNQRAIQFLQGKSHTIGVILPELSESFFSAAISGIEEIAYKRNYTVLLAQSHDDADLEKVLLEKMKTQRVDGLLISVAKTTINFDHFEALNRLQIPIVFFDRIPAIKNIHSVASNLETGTYEAVSFLLKKGHRTIGMINGPTNMTSSAERKNGYIKAMTSHRLKYDPSLMIHTALTEEDTIQAMNTFIHHKRKPTAVVTFNDYVALFAMRYARSQNLKINKDIEFVSYANLPIIEYMENTPIASVEQFPFKQGQKAADILLDLINSPKPDNSTEQAWYKVVVESELVTGKNK
ncbi:LacI family DNA-binding transcriptional regulator [Pedobacter antarcticus]|uniref:LacI family transcriptional regulator n=2 Tax=Pedobacter antarcticus TaxID=34086 RepID=A0A081PBC0_9SPHI|nr:LacI family DNA-binding transcriptional regulator [Pedobacter antarcticus]KEQ27993.1 LacI family transcriptional regulator [Pedobacter antarcticus 4BY]SDL71857.1 transcriptional regulator, LacI family [Pedobacter antarcticus]SFE86532.1 transcriptional regulator, LacI family [Pedobacter antarcticus]